MSLKFTSAFKVFMLPSEDAQRFQKHMIALFFYALQAGPNIRHKCLQTILRMIFYSPPELLRQVLVNQAVSRYVFVHPFSEIYLIFGRLLVTQCLTCWFHLHCHQHHQQHSELAQKNKFTHNRLSLLSLTSLIADHFPWHCQIHAASSPSFNFCHLHLQSSWLSQCPPNLFS